VGVARRGREGGGEKVEEEHDERGGLKKEGGKDGGRKGWLVREEETRKEGLSDKIFG